MKNLAQRTSELDRRWNKTNMKPISHLSLSLLVAGAVFAASFASAQYTITEITGCDTGVVELGGLTRQGEIVVSCFVESGNPEFPYALTPFLINRSGAHELGRVAGGLFVSPAGINGRGEVIANKRYPCPSRAFLLRGLEVKDLGTLGGDWSVANGINESGHVVGAAGLPDGTGRAFLYQNGVMRDLGGFGATRSEATAINGKGQIVFNRTFGTNVDAVTTAAIYSRGGLEEFVLPGATRTRGLGINFRGHVAGVGVFTNAPDDTILPYDRSQAFFYHDGTIENLQSIFFERVVGLTLANSVNDQDEVVGTWYNAFDGEEVFGGFLYRNGVVMDVEGLLPANSGWSIKTAESINSAGQIVGSGYYLGTLRFYLLSPPKADRDQREKTP